MTDLNKTIREYKAIKAASRRAFITRLGSAGLGVAAGAAIAGCGGGGGGFGSSPASASGGSGPISEAEVKAAFLDIQQDENDHVTYLINTINAISAGAARPRPTFDKALLTVPNEATLWTIADALENTGPGAYLYAAPFITAGAGYVQAAASIAIVEGRHAGFLNILTGKNAVLTSPLTTPPDMRRLPRTQSIPPPSATPRKFHWPRLRLRRAPCRSSRRATGSIQPGNAPAGANTGTGITYLNGGPGFPTDNFSDSGSFQCEREHQHLELRALPGILGA